MTNHLCLGFCLSNTLGVGVSSSMSLRHVSFSIEVFESDESDDDGLEYTQIREFCSLGA